LIRLKSWEDLYESPGFTRDVDPKAVTLKEIIGVYGFESRQPCGLRTCRQPHGNGYLVATTEGILTNLGSVCGKNNFSVAFTSLKKSFDKELAAKERRERLKSLKSRLPGLLSRIERIKTEVAPHYSSIRLIAGDVSSDEVPSSVVDAVRTMRRTNDGVIRSTRRATKQEQQIAEETGATRPGVPYYVSEIVGRLANISAIADSKTLREVLRELEPALDQLHSAEVDALSEKDAKRIGRLTAGVDSRLDHLTRIADSVRAFATRGNLSQLAILAAPGSEKQSFSKFLTSLSLA